MGENIVERSSWLPVIHYALLATLVTSLLGTGCQSVDPKQPETPSVAFSPDNASNVTNVPNLEPLVPFQHSGIRSLEFT